MNRTAIPSLKRCSQRFLQWGRHHSYESPFNFPFGFAALSLLTLSLSSLTYCDGEKVYRRQEVEEHKTKDTGIWVTFKDGVYDVTKFVPNHPGGRDKIMMAAGKDIEPFWNVYRQHYNSPLPQELLKSMRIGTLHPDDQLKVDESRVNENDPFRNDPVLSPVLKYLSRQPLNVEPPGALLLDNWITPTDLWFVRNHHPVPRVDEKDFHLDIVIACDVLGKKRSSEDLDDDQSSDPLISFSLEDLKTLFPKSSVITSIQCGGNRRAEMTNLERTNGSNWDISAMSTAKWSGVRLRDLLQALEISEESLFDENGQETSPFKHLQFVGAEGMEASIPLRKGLSRFGDVLLAYEMNDQPIPPQHGFPLRAIVPGHVGVRNVKWLSKIRLSGEEAHGPWQRGMAYKGFSPSVKSLENIDVEKIPSLQEQPVTSAIAIPSPLSRISVDDSPMTVKGYAYSGGGRGIVRVDVSIDGGKTWKTAELTEGREQPMDRAWAWTLWECDIDIPENLKNSRIEILSKATDAAYNVQPDTVKGIWNLRGINNNAWHRIPIDVVEAVDEDSDDSDNE